MILRLIDWIFRIKRLPVMRNGQYVPGELRPPTFGEAITGISGT